VIGGDDRRGGDSVVQAAAGTIASGVAAELIAPLRELRDGLAVIVETLDKHFAAVKGPTPYPYAATKALRERVAEAYLTSRQVTRLTADLARAIGPRGGAAEPCDLNRLLEEAIGLARHRIGEIECELDAGDIPLVRAVPGELVLLFATLLIAAADSARAVAGARIAVVTCCEVVEVCDFVVFEIVDEGVGWVEGKVEFLVECVLSPHGGTLELGPTRARIAIAVPR
jgi:signal transduction histidine kinase